MAQQLVSFDTDRIKDYLFATTVLSDVRQASSLLDHLNQERIAETLVRIAGDASSVERVYTAGGSALAVLADEAVAEAAIRAVEALYRRETVVASITGVRVPLSEADRHARFGQKVREAAHLLRRRKDEKGRALSLPVPPYVRPCDACAQSPAAWPDQKRGQLVCRACQIKRPADAGESRRGLWDRLVGVTKKSPSAPTGWADLMAETEGRDCHNSHKTPQDLSAIGDSAGRRGYVALVYADGNNVGRVLEDLATLDSYRRFAELLDDLLLRITYRRLMEQVAKRPGQSLFELLMAGGDDLMLVTTPEIALPLVLKLVADFASYSEPLVKAVGLDGVSSLSLSVGVLIAKAEFPMHAMRDLAAGLQRLAKRRSAEEGGAGAVDFMVVTGPGSQSVDRVREDILTERGFAFPPGGGERYRLTRRPYLVPELERLLQAAEDLKKARFPAGQLQAMYEALFYSPAQASLVTLQTVGRARENHREPLERFFRTVEGAIVWPWRETKTGRETVYETALGDLVELYPFL